jgi:hypothetical protein
VLLVFLASFCLLFTFLSTSCIIPLKQFETARS